MKRGQKAPHKTPSTAIEMYCSSCNRLLPRTTDYFNMNHQTNALRRQCRECCKSKAKERQQRPEANKRHCDRLREKNFGLTAEEYELLLNYQDNKCMICQKNEWRLNRIGNVRNLSVDHDHDTGSIRGLLCASCNAGLGHFRDSVSLLVRAIQYLKEHHKTEELLAVH